MEKLDVIILWDADDNESYIINGKSVKPLAESERIRELIVAAPETARQRDELLAACEKVSKAFEAGKIVKTHPYSDSLTFVIKQAIDNAKGKVK